MKISHRVVLFAAAAWLALLSLAQAQGLPMGKADELGFAPARLAHITEMLKGNIDKHDIPGAVLLIARHGKIAYFESLGALDPQGKAPMSKDAIFRIYSMSKPITTVAAMMLFEEGRITLDEPVGKYLPSLAKPQVGVEKPDPAGGPATLELVPAKRATSIQDLMRHSSGITYASPSCRAPTSLAPPETTATRPTCSAASSKSSRASRSTPSRRSASSTRSA